MKHVALLPVVLVLSATTVAAQGSEPHRISIGAAAGIATPLHGDLNFTPAAWQVDVRINTSRHFASSVFFEQWQRNEEEVRTGVQLLGPTGPLGRVDRIVQTTTYRTRVAGWSLLARSTGRVAVSGGGGVSYLLYSRDFTQRLSGCEPASLCTDAGTEFDNSAFAGQFQAGVDVEIAPHLAVMGQFRLVAPLEDPGSGHHTVLGGMRVLF